MGFPPGEAAGKEGMAGRAGPGAEGKEGIALFGEWQTEPYVPPPVVDGRCGNVTPRDR